MGAEYTILKLRVLDALNENSVEKIHSILRNALQNTSQHWQERALANNLATVDDFFYDTYIGDNPELLAMNKK
tara:strand:- start:2604 stop:2822 length:219 start_codon:yes stop_codon:yes gene_type:complete